MHPSLVCAGVHAAGGAGLEAGQGADQHRHPRQPGAGGREAAAGATPGPARPALDKPAHCRPSHFLQVHEDRVIELVEKLTSAGLPEGQWIASVDLVEEAGGRLAVREMGRPGVCGVECKTVERAAEQIMGEHDTDVAEALFTVGCQAAAATPPHARLRSTTREGWGDSSAHPFPLHPALHRARRMRSSSASGFAMSCRAHAAHSRHRCQRCVLCGLRLAPADGRGICLPASQLWSWDAMPRHALLLAAHTRTPALHVFASGPAAWPRV